jgi:hypothetical protein
MCVKSLAHKNQMRKKKITNASTSWVPSEFGQSDLTKAQKEGFIAEGDQVIFPSTERIPKPPSGYWVMFLAFLLRGLSLSAHEFLRGLLFVYDVQLPQLTPNSIFTLPASSPFVNLSLESIPIGLSGNSFSASAPVYLCRKTWNWAGLLFLCAPKRII